MILLEVGKLNVAANKLRVKFSSIYQPFLKMAAVCCTLLRRADSFRLGAVTLHCGKYFSSNSRKRQVLCDAKVYFFCA